MADWLEEGSTGFPLAYGKPGNVREFDWFSRPGKVRMLVMEMSFMHLKNIKYTHNI